MVKLTNYIFKLNERISKKPLIILNEFFSLGKKQKIINIKKKTIIKYIQVVFIAHS